MLPRGVYEHPLTLEVDEALRSLGLDEAHLAEITEAEYPQAVARIVGAQKPGRRPRPGPRTARAQRRGNPRSTGGTDWILWRSCRKSAARSVVREAARRAPAHSWCFAICVAHAMANAVNRGPGDCQGRNSPGCRVPYSSPEGDHHERTKQRADQTSTHRQA